MQKFIYAVLISTRRKYMTKVNSIWLSATTIALLGLGLSGCGTAIKLSNYQPQNLKKADNIPSKERLMSNDLPKVIVMDINDNGIEIARQSKLGKSIATNINTNLAKAKSVKLIKRVENISYEKMISNEIKAAELSKEIGADVGQADYILTGQISNATYDHTFREGYYYNVTTKEGKELRYQPPAITYKACSMGNIKIFMLPTLEEAETFEFNECSSTSEEARSAYQAKKRNDGLVRKSASEAADTIKYPLKNFFAKKGYIFEMMKDDDNIIVKTTLGKQFGAIEGEEVDIYSIETFENSLTGESKKTEVKIATGTISNQLNKDFSWIIINNVMENKEIKAGDYIKIKYEEGMWSKLGKSIN
jgi:TolB-like protein